MIPPWAIPTQPFEAGRQGQLGPRPALTEVEVELQAVLVERSAGEAVVGLELE